MSATRPVEEHAESDSYAQSGFCTRMGWGARPALLLIDVCRAYWHPGSPLDLSANPTAAAAPDSMRRLLAAARGGGDGGADAGARPAAPVLWTAVEYRDPRMRDAGLFWHKARALDVFRAGDPRGLGGWPDGDGDGDDDDDGRRLRPREGEVLVTKKYASGFFGTTLASELACLGVDTVVIAGVSTSGCVRATALDAMQHGFRPMVVGSACGDRSPDIHNANLFDLNAKYADVVTEDEAIEHLKAGWPPVEST